MSGGRLVELAALAREHPVAAALEIGTLLACVVLFVGTIALLASGPPAGRGDPWLVLIALGAAVVLLWTVFAPLYERRLE